MQKEVIIIGCNGFVLALNLATGEESWRAKLRSGVLSSSRGSDVSVLVDAERVYAGCDGRIYALRLSDGSMLWQNELKGIGFNEVALAMQGINTQFITRVEHHQNS
jgi:outer membrane protein assembly factor BamB